MDGAGLRGDPPPGRSWFWSWKRPPCERGNSRPGRKGLGCPETQGRTEAPSRRLRHRTGVLSWGLGRVGQLGGEGCGEAMCLQIAEAQLPGPWGPKCTLQTLPRGRGQEIGIRLHSQSQNLEPAGSEGHTPESGSPAVGGWGAPQTRGPPRHPAP